MTSPLRRDVHWSPDEDHQLRTLARAGETAANIAKQINRSPGSVRNRALRLGITIKKSRRVTMPS
jgi:IS30 family transposase